jgi:hypothetical protein
MNAEYDVSASGWEAESHLDLDALYARVDSGRCRGREGASAASEKSQHRHEKKKGRAVR